MHVLLIEDSPRLQESVSLALRRSGYAVDVVGDGEAGLRHARLNPVDVIILDLMLPSLDGLTVLKRLREGGCETHVLILTAKGAVDDRVLGLRHGADDYLVKPFSLDELLARIDALVRRRYQQKNPVLTIGPLAIDTRARLASRNGSVVDLSTREYALLEYLAYRRGFVVGRHEIEDHLYGENNFPSSNVVDRVVCTLRKKIEAPGDPPLLVTRRGHGYILQEPTP
jgi:DNA-binding response OmpR family regulator